MYPDDFYYIYIKPFLMWVEANRIQTFVDVIGDMVFVGIICPLIIACALKFLFKGFKVKNILNEKFQGKCEFCGKDHMQKDCPKIIFGA